MESSSCTVDGLTGARAVVTGGAKGIGAAVVRQLRASGADVLVTDRNEPADPADNRFVRADVSTPDGVKRVVSQALELWTAVDIIVSNVGGQTLHAEGVTAFTDADWARDLDTNLMSAVRLDRGLVPSMIEQRRGAIVHVTSGAARMPRPPSIAYSASKAALTAYSKGLSVHLGPHGIRVNCVAPGVIRTAAFERRVEQIAQDTGGNPEGAADGLVSAMNIPLRRAGTPDELAALVVFLVSPAASYLTGGQYVADGGLISVI